MDNTRWLTVLADELRRHGVDATAGGQVVAEAATHLHDSGQPAVRVFGSPLDYAAAVAASLNVGAARPPRRPPGEVLLEARDIGKRYRRRTVLSDVQLVVRSGEVAAVVGANGCGKSTFLQICAGLVGADRGRVTVRGTLGYCPQDGGVCEFLSPDEHFVLVGAGRGMSRENARQTGRAHAAALDWDPVDRLQARHLSGGTRQKLNLVMAGLGAADVLLLDEPYQGFDRSSYLDFWEYVWRWRDAGKAIVVVTHLLSHLDRVDTVLDLTPARRAVA